MVLSSYEAPKCLSRACLTCVRCGSVTFLCQAACWDQAWLAHSVGPRHSQSPQQSHLPLLRHYPPTNTIGTLIFMGADFSWYKAGRVCDVNLRLAKERMVKRAVEIYLFIRLRYARELRLEASHVGSICLILWSSPVCCAVVNLNPQKVTSPFSLYTQTSTVGWILREKGCICCLHRAICD